MTGSIGHWEIRRQEKDLWLASMVGSDGSRCNWNFGGNANNMYHRIMGLTIRLSQPSECNFTSAANVFSVMRVWAQLYHL